MDVFHRPVVAPSSIWRRDGYQDQSRCTKGHFNKDDPSCVHIAKPTELDAPGVAPDTGSEGVSTVQAHSAGEPTQHVSAPTDAPTAGTARDGAPMTMGCPTCGGHGRVSYSRLS